jgi:hypothetical protein
MSKHSKGPARLQKAKVPQPQTHAVTQALLQRVDQRAAATGALTIPAVPALLDFYVDLCASVFAAVGRRFTAAEREQAKLVIEDRFESTHLPEHAWPPTPAFAEWATCQHLFALPPDRCPVELRWLVYRKPIN